MNRLIELQDTLIGRKKKRSQVVEGAGKKREVVAKEKSYENSYEEVFSIPAYNYSRSRGVDPMNDLYEREESYFSGDFSVEFISPHCKINEAEDASTAHFTLNEFKCKDAAKTPVPKKLRGNIQVLMEQLEELRTELNTSISVNSGYRTVEHNKAVGGESQSMHLCGMAADIKVKNYTPKQVKDTIETLIASGRMKEGGIGLYNTFVHYDIRGKKARWNQASSEAQSYFGSQFSVGFYDWPDKFGKGDTKYDQDAAKWITANRDAVTIFSELVLVVTSKATGTQHLPATTDVLAKQKAGFSTLGYNYEGHPESDPLPDWKETDTTKKKAFGEIYKELKLEGGVSSVNTWDNQMVTLGWGFSLLFEGGKHNEGIKVLQYNMDESTDFKNAMLEVGIAMKGGILQYFAPTPARILTGADALVGFKWNNKVLSRYITEIEKTAQRQIAANVNARVWKEMKMRSLPSDFYSWPTDSMRLAMILSHWAPVGINWSALSGSGGNVATIVKQFSRNMFGWNGKGYGGAYEVSKLANGAIYANDIRRALARRGNVGIFTRSGFSTVAKSAFKDEFKTDAKYKDYVFVELDGKVYLLP